MRLGKNRKIVVLCGSTRFKDAFIQANKDETLAGNIVLSVGMFGHQEGIDMEGQIKKDLDDLHLDKIDLAHEVLVVNGKTWTCTICGNARFNGFCDECEHNKNDTLKLKPYIGESTRRGIEYAKQTGKPVRYLNPVE